MTIVVLVAIILVIVRMVIVLVILAAAQGKPVNVTALTKVSAAKLQTLVSVRRISPTPHVLAPTGGCYRK